ncbi:Cyclic nucleotide-gated potassium channel [Pirellulimonas nuda]|uniref:Cyclic nucleotide-gated potassium channel n=1 Tax=Pirellulimonas nuda TaxID=2528009 RepID=A0A518D6E2_9BACT|nr:transporter substrate-binding domain-containing protein [Pirellulimonas nuda]QDU87050.1 Cyclic nucleotide-gated potassium channel [Pirellulimonas nuda]
MHRLRNYRTELRALALLLAIGPAVAVADDPLPTGVLRVATKQAPPFAMREPPGPWRGISIDLVEAVRKELETVRDEPVTLDLQAMTLEEMLAAVEAGEVDLAAAALTVSFEREQRVDFSHPYYNSGLGIAIGPSQRSPGLWSFAGSVMSPTFLKIVGGLLATMLATAVAVYFFERRVNREQFGGGVFRGVASGLWWSAVTLTTVGYGDKVPKSTAGRMVGMMWMFSGLFIIASFTAAVTSALTVNQLRSRINGPADLSRVRVTTVEGSTSAAYLRLRRVAFRTHAELAGALDALQAGRCDAVVYDAPLLRYEVHGRDADAMSVLPTVFARQDYAFALPPSSPIRETVNQALLRATSSGAWDESLEELLGDPLGTE